MKKKETRNLRNNPRETEKQLFLCQVKVWRKISIFLFLFCIAKTLIQETNYIYRDID